MKEKLSNEYIKETIIDLENKFPVNNWRVNGVDVWPYVRNRVYIFLLNYHKELTPSASNSHAKDKPKSISQPGSNLKQIFESFYRYQLFINSLNPKKIIFFGSSFHRTNYKKLKFNRLFDPMIDFHGLHKEIYIFENSRTKENLYNNQNIIPFKKYLDYHNLLKKVESRIWPFRSYYSLEKYDDFHRYFVQRFYDSEMLRISKTDIIKWAVNIHSTSVFFRKVFRKTRPKRIIMLSYNAYNDFYAAIYAAHKLNIEVIDLQHGFQTNLHMVYSHWTKFPSKAYNTMPTEYWNWDIKSKLNIEKWAIATNIKAKHVGHPFLKYWMEKSRSIYKHEKIIFYSLGVQSITDLFPNELISLIKNLNFKWIFRMHPRAAYTEEYIYSYLKNYELSSEKFEVENAFDSPLPKTLAESFLHVTNFSGCVIEAKMMGIPTIIIHESGKDFFKDYIDDYLVYYLPISETGFLSNFQSVLSKLSQQEYTAEVGQIFNPLKN